MTPQPEQTSQTQAAPDAGALGALIASYDKGFPATSVGWCGAALLFAFGVFVFWLGMQNRANGDPDSVMSGLYALGVIAMAAGLGLGFLIRRLNAVQPAYYLYEHGLRISNRDGEQTALYCDIEEMFSPNASALAFRISPQTPWIFIANYREQAEILRELHGRHMVERSMKLFKRALYGHTALFRYFPNYHWLTKKMLMHSPATEIRVNTQELTIGTKSIDIGRIGDIDVRFWRGKATITDKDGAVFHSMPVYTVSSFDVMVALIRGLQQFHSRRPPS